MRAGYVSEVFVSFQGEGLYVGQRQLFVRFAGCNLRCRYCDTPGSLGRAAGYTLWLAGRESVRGRNPLPAAALRRLLAPLFEREGPVDGVALTGGEPLLQAPFVAECLRMARFRVPVLLETNGTLPAALEEVIDDVAVVSMDLKLPSNTGERAFWDEHAAFARIALRQQLYVKILVDGRTDRDEFEHAVEIVADLPRSVPVFIQPITGERGSGPATGGPAAVFHGIARRRVNDVRVLPQVHTLCGWQ